jgi:hypothetical protein
MPGGDILNMGGDRNLTAVNVNIFALPLICIARYPSNVRYIILVQSRSRTHYVIVNHIKFLATD